LLSAPLGPQINVSATPSRLADFWAANLAPGRIEICSAWLGAESSTSGGGGGGGLAARRPFARPPTLLAAGPSRARAAPVGGEEFWPSGHNELWAPADPRPLACLSSDCIRWRARGQPPGSGSLRHSSRRRRRRSRRARLNLILLGSRSQWGWRAELAPPLLLLLLSAAERWRPGNPIVAAAAAAARQLGGSLNLPSSSFAWPHNLRPASERINWPASGRLACLRSRRLARRRPWMAASPAASLLARSPGGGPRSASWAPMQPGERARLEAVWESAEAVWGHRRLLQLRGLPARRDEGREQLGG